MKINILILSIITILLSTSTNTIKPERQWSSYRGYYANGVLDNANLPDQWDVSKNQNVKWKKEIPGIGLSCPIIWGDKLFITTAVSEKDKDGLEVGMLNGSIAPVKDDSEHEWKVYCFNKNNGDLIWKKTSFKGNPKIRRHPKSSHANCTMATNGQYVVAFFGSEGLYCYDMNGNLVWKKNFGVLRSSYFGSKKAEWEFASSPIIHDGTVIIQCDIYENSFVGAFDVRTGEEIWKKDRLEYPGWCTPNIYSDNGKTRVVLNGYRHRGAYDFETGEEIWKMSGGGDIPIPTPLVKDNLIYFNSAHGKQAPIYVVKTDATGDISLKEEETTNDHIIWSIKRGGSYMQTMLLYGDYLFNCRWNGVLTCYNAKNGEEYFKERLGGSSTFTASPVASDGKLYVTDDNGIVYIVKVGEKFEVLTENPLGDICMTTPAITDNMIYFRTSKQLIAIGN